METVMPWWSSVGRNFTFLFGHWHSQAEDEDNSLTLTSETNMATISSLSPGKIYAFQVRARTAVGYGPYSGKMYFQTLTGGKCCHFVLRSAHDHLPLACVSECIGLSSGGLLSDTPTQLVFLFLMIFMCRFVHSEKLHAVRGYWLCYCRTPQPCSLLDLCLWPAGAECASENLFRGMWQYIALYTAVVWPSAVTGHLTAECLKDRWDTGHKGRWDTGICRSLPSNRSTVLLVWIKGWYTLTYSRMSPASYMNRGQWDYSTGVELACA